MMYLRIYDVGEHRIGYGRQVRCYLGQNQDHADVLAKIKKAISAAMMAGMLASPMAAKDMKKANTYNINLSIRMS